MLAEADASARVLQRAMQRFLFKVDALPKINYKNHTIQYSSIYKFVASSKADNDAFNLQRELVIAAIINDDVPHTYFAISKRWTKMRNGVITFVNDMVAKTNPGVTINTIACEHKAGRKNNNDLALVINDTIRYRLEFKFNAKCVDACPQFVSPYKPSVYLDRSFEEWFYDTHLPKIAVFGGLAIPSRDVYLSTINNNKVECMTEFKAKYKVDREFNKCCKQVDKVAIKDFIKHSSLSIEALSNYLQASQHNKHYMCYCDGMFHYDKLDDALYVLDPKVSVGKESTNYIATCSNGAKLEVKLRFKNGCGLQFPAFQIKRKIPTKKEILEMCAQRNIKINKSMLKDDLIKELDLAGIVY
jgi:hypothetical protein